MLESTWWNQQQAGRNRFRGESEQNLENQFNEIDKVFQSLSLSRRKRVEALISDGIDEVEKKLHQERLQQLSREEEEEKRKQKSERSKELRFEELKVAQARAEKEREQRITLAKRLEKERLEIEKKEQKARDEEIELKKASEREKYAAKTSQVTESKRSGSLDADKPDPVGYAQNKANPSVTNTSVKPLVFGSNQEKQPTGNLRSPSQGALHCPNDIQAEFRAYQERISWIKVNIKEATSQQPADIRKQLMEIKLQLRPRFGQLTNSKAQLVACRNAVKEVFSNAKSSGSLFIFQYTLNLYSKLLVEQSESEANVQLQNALPLAMLTILLWDEFPELGDYVLPRIVKHCPQVIGYHCPIGTEEGRARMGWKRDGDNYETQEQYMGRLAGTCAVWACMTQSKLNTSKDKPHPYNLSHSWLFVSRQLNKPPAAVNTVDFALLAAWWDMTALRFSEAFGKQGTKLLKLVWDDFTRGHDEPPAMRLRGLGENWQLTGKIEHAWVPLK